MSLVEPGSEANAVGIVEAQAQDEEHELSADSEVSPTTPSEATSPTEASPSATASPKDELAADASPTTLAAARSPTAEAAEGRARSAIVDEASPTATASPMGALAEGLASPPTRSAEEAEVSPQAACGLGARTLWSPPSAPLGTKLRGPTPRRLLTLLAEEEDAEPDADADAAGGGGGGFVATVSAGACAGAGVTATSAATSSAAVTPGTRPKRRPNCTPTSATVWTDTPSTTASDSAAPTSVGSGEGASEVGSLSSTPVASKTPATPDAGARRCFTRHAAPATPATPWTNNEGCYSGGSPEASAPATSSRAGAGRAGAYEGQFLANGAHIMSIATPEKLTALGVSPGPRAASPWAGETEMELVLDLANHVPCNLMNRLMDVLQSRPPLAASPPRPQHAHPPSVPEEPVDANGAACASDLAACGGDAFKKSLRAEQDDEEDEAAFADAEDDDEEAEAEAEDDGGVHSQLLAPRRRHRCCGCVLWRACLVLLVLLALLFTFAAGFLLRGALDPSNSEAFSQSRPSESGDISAIAAEDGDLLQSLSLRKALQRLTLGGSSYSVALSATLARSQRWLREQSTAFEGSLRRWIAAHVNRPASAAADDVVQAAAQAGMVAEEDASLSAPRATGAPASSVASRASEAHAGSAIDAIGAETLAPARSAGDASSKRPATGASDEVAAESGIGDLAAKLAAHARLAGENSAKTGQPRSASTSDELAKESAARGLAAKPGVRARSAGDTAAKASTSDEPAAGSAVRDVGAKPGLPASRAVAGASDAAWTLAVRPAVEVGGVAAEAGMSASLAGDGSGKSGDVASQETQVRPPRASNAPAAEEHDYVRDRIRSFDFRTAKLVAYTGLLGREFEQACLTAVAVWRENETFDAGASSGDLFAEEACHVAARQAQRWTALTLDGNEED
eukprot:TRINITY_DN26298_c0_g2_i1.p1 TRINITY_DN26298_c0_g2~~TRINITY_DN26298_c0_g2_i1.p1  ORF type:complete len:914 (+),score=225.06 TRINITY_DN26298_c0_g2_i1:70-2811(+)